MSEEISKLSSGEELLENRVGPQDSAVDKVELPHGGSSGSTSGNQSVGMAGEHREEWADEQASKLPPVSVTQKRSRDDHGEATGLELGESPPKAQADQLDAEQTRI
jgi:hypothetical protein